MHCSSLRDDILVEQIMVIKTSPVGAIYLLMPSFFWSFMIKGRTGIAFVFASKYIAT